MNEHRDRGHGPTGQVGRAIMTDEHVLCWTPCHRQAVRLVRTDPDPWATLAATCPSCGALWTVEPHAGAAGTPAHVVWRPVPA